MVSGNKQMLFGVFAVLFFIALLVLLQFGLGPLWRVGGVIGGTVRMNKATAHGVVFIPEVAEFNRLYPNSKNFITHWSGAVGNPSWNSDARVDVASGRFVIAIQCDIVMNGRRDKVISYSNIRVFIRQVLRTEIRDGVIVRESYGKNITFGSGEWSRLVHNGGDIETTFPELGVWEEGQGQKKEEVHSFSR